jgi:peptidoglycan/LPS O-acetylase OafA/YrhL
MVQAWDPRVALSYAFNEQAWSVSVEFFLYAYLPLLVPALSLLRSPRSILATAAAVAAACVALTGWSY